MAVSWLSDLQAETKKLGVYDNTYFIISSDHGGAPPQRPPCCLCPGWSNPSQ